MSDNDILKENFRQFRMEYDSYIAESIGSAAYSLPSASATTKGGVKIGNGLAMNGDTLNCTVSNETYTLPTASPTVKGGVKVGSGLSMNGDTLNVTMTAGETYTLPTASSSTKGGVKIGTGLSMNGDTLNCTVTAGPASPAYSDATSLQSGLMSAADKQKLDRIAFVENARTETVSGGTSYVVPDYLSAYDGCYGMNQIRWYKNDKYLTSTTDGDIFDLVVHDGFEQAARLAIERGYLEGVSLEEVTATVNYQILCQSTRIGNLLISHEHVDESAGVGEGWHQLAIAVDVDKDGTSDDVFVIPGDLSASLAAMDSRFENLETRDYVPGQHYGNVTLTSAVDSLSGGKLYMGAGRIFLNAESGTGGTITATGDNGGTIDLYGENSGGAVNLNSNGTGGIIKMSGATGVYSQSGSITGSPHFPQGLFVGDGTRITRIWIDSGKLKITTDGQGTLTFTPDA